MPKDCSKHSEHSQITSFCLQACDGFSLEVPSSGGEQKRFTMVLAYLMLLSGCMVSASLFKF
jgi:hypothetical protein